MKPRPRHRPGPRGARELSSSAGTGQRPGADASVERLHGYRAGLAVIAKRPDDVVRIACVRDLLPDVEGAFRSHGRAMDIGVLDESGIERLAHTSQHEGLCLEVRARRWASAQELTELLTRPPHRAVAVALDRVRNSYNIGAILRSAAFFGVDAVLLGAPAPHPGLDPNAIRVAEGAAEHLVVSRTTDLADTLSRLRTRGVKVIGTDGQATTSALEHRFPRPSIVVLGNEREGLGPRVRAQCDEVVAIRGSGSIESLNVGVAAGILIGQLTRATPAPRPS